MIETIMRKVKMIIGLDLERKLEWFCICVCI